MSRRRRKSRNPPQHDIPFKANRVLNLILVSLLLIVVRVWHLSVIQYDDRVEAARRPQRKVVVEPAKRGTIRDRFNHPLAINKIQYNAAVIYSQIRQIPGKKRKEYIKRLSQMLGEKLQLDWERIEDLVHAKAALYHNVPFVIKLDLSESEYYSLKMLEMDWPGLNVQLLPRRFYPQGKVASDILGFMGAISREEYDRLMLELHTLEVYAREREEGLDPELPPGFLSAAEAHTRLKELQEHAYTIHDYVGKSGIEARFEEELRGFYGKRSYVSDSRGNYLRELPGSVEALSGQRLLLSISLELQEYAEKLLLQNESIRPMRVSGVGSAVQEILSLRKPWIKGGAIVAMDPKTGEVIALASYPRFDPNDFIACGDPGLQKVKQENIHLWFETENCLGKIWDQQVPLRRETENGEERLWLTWEKYLDFLLPAQNEARRELQRMRDVRSAVALQKDFESLLELFQTRRANAVVNALYPDQTIGDPLPAVEKDALEEKLQKYPREIALVKSKLDRHFSNVPNNYDKILLVDLCRLAVDGNRFSDLLLKKTGDQTLSEYRDISADAHQIMEVLREMTEELFRVLDFKNWREEFAAEFLKEKRAEEKLEKRYAKPYIDLLDGKEKELFQQFWNRYRWDLLLTFLTGEETHPGPYSDHLRLWHRELLGGAHASLPWRGAYQSLQKSLQGLGKSEMVAYLMTFRKFSDLRRPLHGSYRGRKLEMDLAMSFYPQHGYGFARSHAYRQATTQGSLFKLVTAYEALRQHISRNSKRDLNPLIIVDEFFRRGSTQYIGYTQEGKPIPQLYKGGRLPKSHSSNIGQVDLLKAIEVSSNPYFSLLAAEHLEEPEDLANAARAFSFGSRTGIDLPGEFPGKIPNDLDYNLTGLYSTAIGQHSLVVTPLQTAVMLSAIATKGEIVRPKIVNHFVGKPRERQGGKEWRFAFQETLQMAGLDFLPFAALAPRADLHLIQTVETDIKDRIEISPEIHSVLTNGMQRVVDRMTSNSLPGLSRIYESQPEAISDLIEMKDTMIGKSSTAECVENLNLDSELGAKTYCHTWFGGIVYSPENRYVFRDRYGNPELVVVVYLRYGAWGKDAAPLAAQVAHKWRKIKEDSSN